MAPPPPLVLCIDDQQSNLAIRKMFLEAHGYSVLTAATGLDGLQLLRGEPVDVLVLDYRMPGMDGQQVAKLARSECPKVPIIVLSGYTADIPDSLREMAAAFVAKGSPPEKLLDALRKALGFQPERQGTPPAAIDEFREHTQQVQDHLNRAREHLKLSKKAVSETSSRVAERYQRTRRRS